MSPVHSTILLTYFFFFLFRSGVYNIKKKLRLVFLCLLCITPPVHYTYFFFLSFFRSGIYNIKKVRLVSIFFIYLLCIAPPVHYTYFFFFFLFLGPKSTFLKKQVSIFLKSMHYTVIISLNLLCFSLGPKSIYKKG